MSFRHAGAILALGLCLTGTPAQADNIVKAPQNDRELAVAASKAQASLSEFLKTAIPPAPGTTGHAVKIPLRQGGVTEWVWISGLTLKGADTVAGSLGNTPAIVKGFTPGQTIEVKRSEIVDWIYEKNGRMAGGYSVCVLIGRQKGGAGIAELKAAGFACD
jgi:uncharacterized protein YegJ (DUF2314 family)